MHFYPKFISSCLMIVRAKIVIILTDKRSLIIIN